MEDLRMARCIELGITPARENTLAPGWVHPFWRAMGLGGRPKRTM